MAGYPTPPNHRLAYDQDGTVVKTLIGTTLSTVSASVINDEDDDALGWTLGAFGTVWLIFLFPELRDITHYFAHGWGNYFYSGALQVSTDTTDGQDGTWTTVVTNWANNGQTQYSYRKNISTISASGVKAIRFLIENNYQYSSNAEYIGVIHLYGTKTGTDPGLSFWDASLDQHISNSYLDLGDVLQGATVVKDFRIKNNHATQTAQSITLSGADVSTDMTVEFSPDGNTWSATLSIGDLAPGATSAIYHLRRVVPGTEVTQPHVCRLAAVATSWV